MRLGEHERRKKRNQARQNRIVKTIDQKLDEKVPLYINDKLTVLIRPDQDPEKVIQKYLKR